MRYTNAFIKMLIILIILSIFMCSCEKGETDLNIIISPHDKSIIELSDSIYSSSQLSEIVTYDGSLKDYYTRYSVHCLRNLEQKYRMSFLGENKVVVVDFDASGNKLCANFFRMNSYKNSFDKLSKGHKLAEVKSIDPDGEYLFLFSGRNDLPRISSHCTLDGYIVIIEYDENNIITGINTELL
ncbi:MAG: hypothetical protein IKN38_08840 [Clostridia bacterium]|nr:hypothetical protein [Clostridia bacterium]